MIIIYGSRLYGKVDVVPGFFHVETKFGHLWYIPLIPVGSYLILNKSGDGWNGVQIPLNFKSICFAWLRAASLVGGVVASIIALATAKEGVEHWLTPAMVGVGSLITFALFTMHKGFTHASYDRAHQLGELVGISDRGKQLIDQLYGSWDGSADPFAQGGQES